jgi:hypothetical protein
MALSSPLIVRIEKLPGSSFGTTMCELRTWLDHNEISPVSFLPVTQGNGGIGYEIAFNSEDEASLFERQFGLGAAHV